MKIKFTRTKIELDGFTTTFGRWKDNLFKLGGWLK